MHQMNAQHTLRPTHTLCFLTRGDQILMLRRRKPPNAGLWNGVGGQIEPKEYPLDACLREVREETGFRLATARFGGLITSQENNPARGGVYLYSAPAPHGNPAACNEGILQWHTKEWVFSSPEVAQNIHIFGPPLLNHDHPRHYSFQYRNQRVLQCEVKPLPQWITHFINVSQI